MIEAECILCRKDGVFIGYITFIDGFWYMWRVNEAMNAMNLIGKKETKQEACDAFEEACIR